MKWLMRILGKGKKKRAGFTLIELMVVVIVVGILAAAAIPIYRFALRRAYASEAKATIGTIRTSEVVYATEKAGGTSPTLPTDYLVGKGDPWLDTLGVDTSSNTWWHDEGSGDTCEFGFDTGTNVASATYFVTTAGGLTAADYYIYVEGLSGNVEDIHLAMNIETGLWHEIWKKP